MSSRPKSNGPSAGQATSGAAIRASSAYLLAQLELPAEKVVMLYGSLAARLRPRLIERATFLESWDDGRPVGASVALECADEPGVLLLQGGLALGLVNTVLGLPWPPFAAPLTRIDHGVLEGTLAIVLARLGLASTIRLRRGGVEQPPPGNLALAVSVGLGVESGSAWLLATDLFLHRWWGLREPSCGERSPWIELGVTLVPSLDLAGVEVGDYVVFDDTPALPVAGAWPVCCHWKENSVSARWLAEGSLVAEDADAAWLKSDAATRPERRFLLKTSGPFGTTAGEAIRVSVGVSFSQADAVDWTPLHLPRTSSVLLKANHEPWALGEVTEYEGSLAVSITRRLSG